MKSKLFLLLVTLMCFALVFAACAPAETPPEEEQPGEEQPVVEAEVIKIGAIQPLTGAYGTLGLNMQSAELVAVDIINNVHDIDWPLAQSDGLAGLNNAKVELVFGDAQSDASIAATEAANVLEQGVVGIVGAYASGLTASVAAQALEYNIPMVCGESSSASLTDGVTYDFGPIFNRIAANDDIESHEFFTFIDYLNENYDAGIEKVAIAYLNNSFGIHADEMFAKYAEEFGYEIVARVSYEGTITAADTEAAQIIAADPDVVFHASYIADLTMFAQAYNAYNFQPTMVLCYCGGFQDPSFATVASSLGANFYTGGQACSPELYDKMPIYAYINDLYKARTGYNIDGPALEAFAAVVILADAINAAGSTDPAVISQTLKSETFDAPYFTIGKIKFDEFGQNIYNAAFLTQLINGKYEVVFPIDQYVTAEPVLNK